MDSAKVLTSLLPPKLVHVIVHFLGPNPILPVII